MEDRAYKLKSGVPRFLKVAARGTMEVTIPVGSVVVVLFAPTVGNGFVRARYGEHTCTAPIT
jgi:hypothetical protein